MGATESNAKASAKRSCTATFNGQVFTSKTKMDLARLLMVQGCDMEEAFQLANGTNKAVGARSANVQLNKDITLVKKALSALQNSVRGVSAIKDTKKDEYRRKALAGLDAVTDGVFSGKSREQKFSMIMKGLEGFGLAVSDEIKALQLK